MIADVFVSFSAVLLSLNFPDSSSAPARMAADATQRPSKKYKVNMNIPKPIRGVSRDVDGNTTTPFNAEAIATKPDSSPPSYERSPLLDLPPELRNEIWHHTLYNSENGGFIAPIGRFEPTGGIPRSEWAVNFVHAIVQGEEELIAINPTEGCPVEECVKIVTGRTHRSLAAFDSP